MRGLGWAGALLASCAFSGAAHAQSADIAQATANTLDQQATRRGLTAPQKASMLSQVGTVFTDTVALLSPTQAWMQLLDLLGIPKPFDLASGQRFDGNCNGACFAGGGGGSSGGGGATGGWWDGGNTPSCDDYDYRLDVDGNLIIPSMKLTGGGAMTPPTNGNVWKVYINGDATKQWIANSPKAAGLWQMHNQNMRTIKDQWIGAYAVKAAASYTDAVQNYNIYGASVAHYDAGGVLRHRQAYFGDILYYDLSVQPGNTACPASGQSGGSFNFYEAGTAYNTMHDCVAYAPNSSLSSNGYAYSELTTIAAADVPNFPNGMPDYIRACPISPELIRNIADRLLKKASEKPGGPTYAPVLPEDVKYGGKTPQLKDLEPKPTTLPAPATPSTPPATTTTPSTNPTVNVDFGTAPSNPTPADSTMTPPTGPQISDPAFNWFPSLPAITVNLGTGSCPTYSADIFGTHHVIDIHCTLIEQNRTVISLMMIVLFTMGSVIIVLRA